MRFEAAPDEDSAGQSRTQNGRFVAANRRPPADRDELGGFYRQLTATPSA